jgi:serine/threonine protein kinase
MSERVDNIPKLSRLGRFEILSELGKGAMGIVYLAKDPSIGRLVAIKTIRAGSVDEDDSESREFRERFMREAQTAGILSHPNIVTIYDVGEDKDSGVSFIAMEYIEGKTLKGLVVDRSQFAPDQVADIVGQVAEALDYAHRKGIIHRDIKPANIMITTDGKVKITDFGIAKVASSNLTTTGQFLGTPNYMSPEQVTGAPVDGRSDIFSLGVVLYEMLAHRKPFSGENLTTISYKIVHEAFTPIADVSKNIPAEFDTILSKALSKDPWNRFQRGKDFALSLYQAKARFEEQAIFQDLGTMVSSAENLPTLKLEHLEEVARQGGEEEGEGSGSHASRSRSRPDHDETHPSSPRVPLAAPEAEAAPADAPAPEVSDEATTRDTAPASASAAPPSVLHAAVNPRYWWGIVGAAVLIVAGVLLVLRLRIPKVEEQKAVEAANRAQAELQHEVAAGKALYEKGQYSESLAAFRAILRRDPSMKVARNYAQMSEEGLRNEVSKKAQQEKSAAAATHVQTGREALDAKKYDVALSEAEAALDVDPGNADATKLSGDAREGIATQKRADLKAEKKKKADTLARAGQASAKAASAASGGSASAAPHTSSAAPAAATSLRLAFASPIPKGYLMLAVNDSIIYRKNFDFGKKSEGGMISDTIHVTPGAVVIKVWLTSPDASVRGYQPMNVTLGAGETRTLTLTLQGKKFSAKIS